MSQKFRIAYRLSIKTGKWTAFCPKLPGLFAEAKSRQGARELILQRISPYLLEMRKRERQRHEIPPGRAVVIEGLDWAAPWIDVCICVELPFWLMVNKTTVTVEVEGHKFPVAIDDSYWELHGKLVTDSRATAFYQGPFKRMADLGEHVQELRRKNPDLPLMWRKCKTVLKVETRCNEDLWRSAVGHRRLPQHSIDLYLGELCRAHIPVINQVIRGYRLATYDYFAFEIAQWDVSRWLVRRGSEGVAARISPYRGWDLKPLVEGSGAGTLEPYQLIDGVELGDRVSTIAGPGELELLDALNLMERGDYSGAVRRITTAIEVIVGALSGGLVEAIDGKAEAARFIEKTKSNFAARLNRYEKLSGRKLSDVFRLELKATRKLRHSTVHAGYRIAPGERGRAQRAVDTGRWMFNWFENKPARQRVRETRIDLRSLGRDLFEGVFRTRITAEGVVVLPPFAPLSRKTVRPGTPRAPLFGVSERKN